MFSKKIIFVLAIDPRYFLGLYCSSAFNGFRLFKGKYNFAVCLLLQLLKWPTAMECEINVCQHTFLCVCVCACVFFVCPWGHIWVCPINMFYFIILKTNWEIIPKTNLNKDISKRTNKDVCKVNYLWVSLFFGSALLILMDWWELIMKWIFLALSV